MVTTQAFPDVTTTTPTTNVVLLGDVDLLDLSNFMLTRQKVLVLQSAEDLY